MSTSASALRGSKPDWMLAAPNICLGADSSI
jgi:hypothetical protein